MNFSKFAVVALAAVAGISATADAGAIRGQVGTAARAADQAHAHAHASVKSADPLAEEDAEEDAEDGYGEGGDAGEDSDDGYGDEAADGGEAADGDELDDKFAEQGEKDWHVPSMKPLGYFKKVAGIDGGMNQTVLDTTFKPTMIPHDGFKIRAAKPLEKNETDKVPPFTPPTVGHGELTKLRAKEDEAEDAEVEGDLMMKTEELQAVQAESACAMMTQALALAKAAREEEEATAGEGKVLVDLVNMVCPVLKFHYSFVMRCKVCSEMAARLEKFYAPEFDSKTFPGLEHPDKCDQSKWPTKNFGKLV